MKVERPKKDILEIFGHSPADTSKACRMLWDMGACPFIGRKCAKKNHDKTLVYGVCSVTSPYGECIICPNRLYAENFRALKIAASDAFGAARFLTFAEYLASKPLSGACVVALGMHSGHEIGVKGLSMDWILAKIDDSQLCGFTGVEVQSLDITNNYRHTWHAYRNPSPNMKVTISKHGLNWANVHKRLIPQIIRKELLYSRSPYVQSGLYFIAPEAVYRKFEEIIGSDIPLVEHKAPNVITVYTWGLGPEVKEGRMRQLKPIRQLRFYLSDFSERFISGPSLPDPKALDAAVKKALGVN